MSIRSVSKLSDGAAVYLRDHLPADVDSFIRWQTQGEWRSFDAPWEGVLGTLSSEQEAEMRQRFLESISGEQPFPRKRAVIVEKEHDLPLGWVVRYVQDRFPDVWFVGIDICEDAHLCRGLGTQALSLWVDYLFSNSPVHKIALDTWSFNRRMMRVAEKVGFQFEGVERSMIEWQGQRLDLIHYGILRQEWSER